MWESDEKEEEEEDDQDDTYYFERVWNEETGEYDFVPVSK